MLIENFEENALRGTKILFSERGVIFFFHSQKTLYPVIILSNDYPKPYQEISRCNVHLLKGNTVHFATQNRTQTFSLYVDVVTVTFYMAVRMKIVVRAGYHEKRTVNRARRAALGVTEGKIPTTTAVVTSINPEVTHT